MDGMVIREMKQEDIPFVSRIYALSWKAAYRGIVLDHYLDSLSEGHWISCLSEQGRRALVLFDRGQYAGTVSYGAARDPEMAGFGELISIYLLPEYWSRGCGTQLLRAALAGLRGTGYEKAYLWVLQENRRARRFYERNGFMQDKGRLQTHIGGTELTELRYVCPMLLPPKGLSGQTGSREEEV